MNRQQVNNFLTQSLLNDHVVSQWSGTLLAQHRQLESEIAATYQLLAREVCLLLPLDTQLKKLVKGLILHLELEACYLTPSLQNSELTLLQKQQLTQGYSLLQRTCDATLKYLHALKLEFGNGQVKPQHITHISQFLADISQRLRDEDQVYTTINTKETEHDVI